MLQWWFNVICLTLDWSGLEHQQSHRAVIPTLLATQAMQKGRVFCSGIFNSIEAVLLLLPRAGSLFLCKSTDLLYPACMWQHWPKSLFLMSSRKERSWEWAVSDPGAAHGWKHHPGHGRNPMGALTSYISPATGTRAHSWCASYF